MNNHDERRHIEQIKKNKKERVKIEAKETKKKEIANYPWGRMDYSL